MSTFKHDLFFFSLYQNKIHRMRAKRKKKKQQAETKLARYEPRCGIETMKNRSYFFFLFSKNAIVYCIGILHITSSTVRVSINKTVYKLTAVQMACLSLVCLYTCANFVRWTPRTCGQLFYCGTGSTCTTHSFTLILQTESSFCSATQLFRSSDSFRIGW